ncbi:Carcinoembryonic antigen-related cell adhesion molecule 6 [Orchesella cincta]|uniref:Carcinoembryonic antigen-related cell adhesion molecule 6 n=1 Tax=Orchesella cincta TaxID=48709 RepID=A0A1D2MLD7_ORCCI|nr:Carcinoembryonic antigen-related cell adhesion molecule 6 [Orchesella cincta]
MEGSDQKFVTLGPLDLRSTGMYRCEVSAEGPSFTSVDGAGRMTVVHLPKEGPQISGKVQPEYETGDNLALNCTSAKSFPPARLSWYINDLPCAGGRC